MICVGCRAQVHDGCRGETWCDCQHRIPLPPGMTLDQLREHLMEAGRAALAATELTQMAQEDGLGDHGPDL